jgi:3-oxoacyl-[acyl-carrier protein] reductase
MSDSSSRLIMITGGVGDIGSHLVAHFAAAGWRVLSVDRREPDARPAAGVVHATCDLADPAVAASALDELIRRHGSVDALVNCAGLIANSPFVRRLPDGWQLHDFALWSDVIASGLTTAFHATALCVRGMLEARKKGVVINISSVCAQGNPGQSAYSAAKAGLNGLTLALAKELGPLGIRVVALAPGYFDTSSTARHTPEARLTRLTGAVPLRRLGRVSEIADAIEFIIRNDYVNGTILELDGGLVL